MNLTPSLGSFDLKSAQKEALPTCNGFILQNFFSKQDCASFIAECEVKSFQPLPNTSLENYRTNSRISILDPSLAKVLWKRIVTFLPPTIQYEGSNWVLNSINEHIRFCKYETGQFFDRHIDGHLMTEDGKQSFYTLMIYLNDVSADAGGKTRFYSHDGKGLVIDHVYQPRCGDCICFDQEKLHDGEKIHNGLKYIMRTEVLYAK